MKRTEDEIMSDISGCYAELSPENLTCDGECSPSEVRSRERDIMRRLKALQEEIGRPVSEEATWDWENKKHR